jgi:hypothetical protein
MRDAVGASVIFGGRVAGGVGTSLVLPGCDGETVTEWAGGSSPKLHGWSCGSISKGFDSPSKGDNQ